MSDMFRIPVDRGIVERVRWLIKLRWMILGLATVIGFVGNGWLGNILPTTALWVTLVSSVLYNTVFWALARRVPENEDTYGRCSLLIHGQITADLLGLSVVLHYSGGLENPFSVVYVLPVLLGSILMTKRDAYLYAVGATVLWIGLLVLEATAILPHYNLTGFRLPVRFRQPAHLVAESFSLVSVCFGAAYVASNIHERLREREQQLYEAKSSCELRALELADLNRRLREREKQLYESNSSYELRATELAELNARLQDLDRKRSWFIRLVTHELRAPVAAIQSYLQLILDGYVPQERLSEIIGKAHLRARDQLALIADLLDLAKLGEPDDVGSIVPCDAEALLHDVLDMMQARIADSQLTVADEIAPNLPNVALNDEHVKQVWINLVSNAVKYTPAGGSVIIRLSAEGDKVCGSVRDTGIGISVEEQEHIFEDFYRTEGAKAMARHGTGLGLSIVRGIFERYGGRIWLESQLGEGTTFFFEFPTAA